jgi:hypothetical protein
MAEMSDILREIREIKSTVDKVENIVEKRLIGVVEPLADEQEGIESFKKLKRNRETEYVPLREALRSIRRVQRSSRKTRAKTA